MTGPKPLAQRVDSIALLGGVMALASLGLPYLTLRPNRVMPLGEPISLFDLHAFGGPSVGALSAVAWGALLLAAGLRAGRARQWTVAVLAALGGGLYVLALGSASAGVTGADAGADEYARLGLASGSWLGLGAVYVAMFSVYRDTPRLLLLPLVVIGTLVAVTPFGQLGVMREYQNVSQEFRDELLRHVMLVLAALPLALSIGFPLGVLAARRPRLEGWVLGVAGFLQTVPSVALFGLLLPVLSAYGRAATVAAVAGVLGLWAVALAAWWLARRLSVAAAVADGSLAAASLFAVVMLLPVLGLASFKLLSEGPAWLAQIGWNVRLDSLGLRGLGVAPALVALTAYAILPLIVNTHVGLKSVPAGVVEAARGMGMSAAQVFRRVEVPIAAPFLFEGVRGSLLLLIGLATVAVLVNAGGLGYFLMRGMEQAVPDLVLLGSVPAVVLALTVDAAIRLIALGLTPKGLRS